MSFVYIVYQAIPKYLQRRAKRLKKVPVLQQVSPALAQGIPSGRPRPSLNMVRRHDNLHSDRAEQLKLRGNLANVYDVVRDLGLHYELKEISGCTFITIGRTQHKYSHLDKDLVWTVSTDRVCDNQYGDQNNITLGDVTN